jgi:hypothetical protein
MSVASETPPLDLLDILVLGVCWLIGIPGVGAGGVRSLPCEREESFDLLSGVHYGRGHDQYEKELERPSVQTKCAPEADKQDVGMVKREYVRLRYKMPQWVKMPGRGVLVEWGICPDYTLSI